MIHLQTIHIRHQNSKMSLARHCRDNCVIWLIAVYLCSCLWSENFGFLLVILATMCGKLSSILRSLLKCALWILWLKGCVLVWKINLYLEWDSRVKMTTPINVIALHIFQAWARGWVLSATETNKNWNLEVTVRLPLYSLCPATLWKLSTFQFFFSGIVFL